MQLWLCRFKEFLDRFQLQSVGSSELQDVLDSHHACLVLYFTERLNAGQHLVVGGSRQLGRDMICLGWGVGDLIGRDFKGYCDLRVGGGEGKVRSLRWGGRRGETTGEAEISPGDLNIEVEEGEEKALIFFLSVQGRSVTPILSVNSVTFRGTGFSR
ncbi:hypothetical protein Tco_1235451 [Tanacetum coccineum]